MKYITKTIYFILLIPILIGAIPLYIFGLFLYLVLSLMEIEDVKIPNLFKLIEGLLEEFEKWGNIWKHQNLMGVLYQKMF